MLVEKGEKKIQTLDAQGADGITPAELMRNDHDPYKAVVSARLEALGQILTYAEKIAQECSETVIFQRQRQTHTSRASTRTSNQAPTTTESRSRCPTAPRPCQSR